MALAQFTPIDLAIAISIEPQGEVDVTQGYVPLTAYLLALHVEYQVTVARLVRHDRRTEQQ